MLYMLGDVKGSSIFEFKQQRTGMSGVHSCSSGSFSFAKFFDFCTLIFDIIC
jgi:hypothetical protein